MKLTFYASDKPREQELAAAVLAGAKTCGWDVEQRELCGSPKIERGTTAVGMVGVKSKRLFELTKAAGAIPLMFDKGYIRSRRADARVWDYWRVSPGEHHPTRTSLMRHKMPGDRLEALGLDIRPWRVRGYPIVLAGSSAKYHDFYGLPDPNDYARDLIAQIAKLTDRRVIYRPKPSWKDAQKLKGADYSSHGEAITSVLLGAWALVTHGSNACFEAALVGVPSIVLGDGVGAAISSTSLDDLEEPKHGKREQWLANLAYHQWTEDEYRSGEAFEHIGGWISEIE